MIVFLILCGVLSGIIAGMGMGGGTVLIPLLTLLLGVSQKIAQATNLIVFIPLSIFVLAIYFKRGFVRLNNIGFLMIPSIIMSAIASFFSVKIMNVVLKAIFGILLIVVGITSIVFIFVKIKNKETKV